MNKQIGGHLINFFRQLIQGQKTLQYIRKQLGTLKNYHPIALFRKIGKQNECITIKDMSEYLKGKISSNDKDLYNIFQKIDHKRRGFIDLQDFCRQLTYNKKKSPKIKQKISVTYQIQSKFIQYLSNIIKIDRVLDIWRKQLEIIQPFIIFQALDIHLDGKIGPLQLSHFFIKNKESLSANDVSFLYKIFLRRHYDQINLEVFCENLKPRQFGGYFSFQKQMKRQAEAQIQQKLNRQKQAIQAQQNFHKQLNNQKVIELIHKQASLQRQKQLQDRIRNEIQVYKDLKFVTRKKYHPQLTYDQFLRQEKQNIDRINLQKKMMIEQAQRRQAEYQQLILNINVVRQVQAFERSKIQRLPFMTIKNRIQSNSQSFPVNQLQQRIKKHMMDRMNKQNKNPISRMFGNHLNITSVYGV